VWFDASPAERAAVESMVTQLDARTAFDAAIGQLDRHRGERDYRLWKAVSENGTRLEEWRGRLVAAPTFGRRVLIILKAPMVNVEHLAHELGRPPRRFEIVREFFERPLRGLREVRIRNKRTWRR
jgi:non-ribosomal peptide synthetase component F